MNFSNPFQGRRPEPKESACPPTMVLVQFPQCSIPLSYYNDQFQVQPGDIVFVEGKFAGKPGRVEKVSASFQVDPEDYKRVLGVADTAVSGTFFPLEGRFLTLDPAVLPYSKALSWFKSLAGSGQYIDYDEPGFLLKEPEKWGASPSIWERGLDYFHLDRVAYLSLEGDLGQAIVSGSRAYEVRFHYREGIVTHLNCDCPCGYVCKHDVAVLLQLRQALEVIEQSYAQAYQAAGYFALVIADALFQFALKPGKQAKLILG